MEIDQIIALAIRATPATVQGWREGRIALPRTKSEIAKKLLSSQRLTTEAPSPPVQAPPQEGMYDPSILHVPSTGKPKAIISACSYGLTCRWHGKKSRRTAEVRRIVEADTFDLIPVCPEMLGGLSCPRPPVRTIKGRVYETDESRESVGREVTEFTVGAEKVVDIAMIHGAQAAILVKNSPSCSRSGILGRRIQAMGLDIVPIW